MTRDRGGGAGQDHSSSSGGGGMSSTGRDLLQEAALASLGAMLQVAGSQATG
jgi:hypothetical protein